MSESPPPPQSRPNHGTSGSQWASQQSNEKLQIRVVPYSPPRISSDGSVSISSRPVSYVDSSPLGSPSRHPDGPDRGFIADTSQHSAATTLVPALRRPSPRLTAAPAALSPTDIENVSQSSRASSPRAMSARRPKRIISINSDKTFSLVPQSDSLESSRVESFGSTRLTSTTPSSSLGRVSSNVFLVEDRFCSSPVTGDLPSPSTAAPSTVPQESTTSSKLTRGSIDGYMIKEDECGLGEDSKEKAELPLLTSPLTDGAPSTLPEMPTAEPSPAPQLESKDSFSSTQSDSTMSDRTNYKIYSESSPGGPITREAMADYDQGLPPSSSHSNYQALFESSPIRPNYQTLSESSPVRFNYQSSGDSSPVHEDYQTLGESSPSHYNYRILGESSSSNQSLSDLQRPGTTDSDANYVVHGAQSPSISSLPSSRGRLRSEYSRDSLVVAPLRPIKKRSIGRSGIIKSRSRESLRRGSLTSLGTALAQEATRNLFAGPATVPREAAHRSQGSWDAAPLSTADVMTPRPHHWSAPLSTVMSESEEGSIAPSRSLSPFSASGRRSSGVPSTHSRNLLSMSSSLGGLDEQLVASPPSRNSSPERPPPIFNRNFGRDQFGFPRQIRHHDEDGDGLADLERPHLHHRPSRTCLGTSASNSSSERVPRSSGSTRSVNPFSLPAWARLYYGSGERRFLITQPSTESMRSLYNGSMYNDPPYNDWLARSPHRSPSVERFAMNIRNPRRRARDAPPSSEPDVRPRGSAGRSASTDHAPIAVPGRLSSLRRGVRKQTSSILSPHLRRDRRSSGYSIWDPPSAVWSTESGFDWRRNQQVVLFALGFLIPFAWMTAAVLPLPPKPQHEMTEHHDSTSHLDLQYDPSRICLTVDEMRYSSARWWRNLNRGMSVLGLLVVGAVIALVVLGARQQWGS